MKSLKLSDAGWIAMVIVFLKIVGIINWSWWFVTMPIYGPYVICWLIEFILWMIESPQERRLRKLREKWGLNE